MITFSWYPFQQLSVDQLYAILMLRATVFVVEQNCVYLDPDGKDKEALHLLGVDNNELVAYIRLFPPKHSENSLIFGRVVTASHTRKNGYGKKLMQALLSYCEQHFPGINIKCSAQHYLIKFYESFGFVAEGDVYDEDGIPHIAMQLTK